MNYWQMVYTYFVNEGFPEALLDFVCIHSNEANHITDIIKKRHPNTLLEIGTFIGLSSGVLALASPPTSTLVCVDPNLPVGLFSRQFNFFESRGSLEFVQKMLEHFDLCQKVFILEGYFSCVSSSYKERFIAFGGNAEAIEREKIDIVGEGVEKYAPYDLVLIDGDHSAEAVYSDLSLIYRYLSEDSIVILHDLDPRGYWGRHVQAGIAKFLRDHPQFSLNITENLGILCKKL